MSSMTIQDSRTWHRFVQGTLAWTDQPDGSLRQREIRAGDTVLADPRYPKQHRGTEVVEFFWEGLRCWVDRRLFDRLARPLN